MSDRTKKIIFGVVFVIVSVGIGYAIYRFLFQPLLPSTPTTPSTTPIGQLPQAGTGGKKPPVSTPPSTGLINAPSIPQPPTPIPVSQTTLLRDGVTQAVSATANGQGVRFYNPDDGKFYRVLPDGSIVALSNKQFFNVKNVSWGHTTDKAILQFPDGNNVFYDFQEKRQVTLPQHWQDFDFSPDDQQVAAKSIGLDPDNRFLIVAKNDGNEARAIEPLGNNSANVTVDWSPNNQVVAFSNTGEPQGEGAQQIYLIGENHENFKALIAPGRGFVPNWSPTGQQLLYSVYHERNDLKPSLWVSQAAGDHIGENRRSLNLNTWADKCVWQDESRLICGVPQNLDTGAGLDRSQFAGVPDDIYRVDLQTGVSIKISAADQNHPIRQPVLSADKHKLIFTDAVTGRLFSYQLP